MADLNISTNTMDVFRPELWANKTLDAVEFASNIQKRVTRDFEGR